MKHNFKILLGVIIAAGSAAFSAPRLLAEQVLEQPHTQTVSPVTTDIQPEPHTSIPAPTQPTPTPQTPSLPAPTPTPAPAKSSPWISIPSVGVSAPVVSVGLDPDGLLHVPANTTQVGWYKYGPKVGAVGPVVLTSHLDFGKNFAPGVFYNLHKVNVGDTIAIADGTGNTYTYVVEKKEIHPQDNFPTNAVYGALNYPGLRLITCAGHYDPAVGHYTDDLIVFGRLLKN